MNWVYDNFGWILIAAIIFCLLALFASHSACVEKKNVLVEECKKSGKQNYECQAIFQSYCKSGDSGMYVAPVVVSGRR